MEVTKCTKAGEFCCLIYILCFRVYEEAANIFSKGYGKRGLPIYQNTAENLQHIIKSITDKTGSRQ